MRAFSKKYKDKTNRQEESTDKTCEGYKCSLVVWTVFLHSAKSSYFKFQIPKFQVRVLLTFQLILHMHLYEVVDSKFQVPSSCTCSSVRSR
jgi:hypothetical protein